MCGTYYTVVGKVGRGLWRVVAWGMGGVWLVVDASDGFPSVPHKYDHGVTLGT